MNETTRANRLTARGGFTLVEMLIALGILLIFGVMAATALTYGTQLWRSGHRRSYAFDVATFVFQQIEDDLSAARSQFWGQDEDAYDTRVKFWVDHDGEFDGDWETEGGRQRIRFVRAIRMPTDDDQEENLAEIAYMLGTNTDPADADTTTLYRAMVRPIDQPDSVFIDGNISDPDFDPAVPIAEHILHFEVRLWTQYTTSWELWDEEGDRLKFAPWENSYEPKVCPPVFTWDSDRLAEDGPDFLMDPGRSGFPNDTDDHDNDETVNEDDPDYVRDNVFPRAVKLILVVDPSVEYPSPRRLEVRNDVDDADTEIQVNGELPAYNTAWPYIRINDEWIRFESFEPDDQGGTFIVDERGVRGTQAREHADGVEVKFGMTFTRVFHNPANREYWGQ